jgi:hypothetical protein
LRLLIFLSLFEMSLLFFLLSLLLFLILGLLDFREVLFENPSELSKVQVLRLFPNTLICNKLLKKSVKLLRKVLVSLDDVVSIFIQV